MTIMQLAGFPSEVVELGGLRAFAHGLRLRPVERRRFAAAVRLRGGASLRAGRQDVGFGPTKRALSRIAKEGRKYGVFLGLVTQRPAEIDPNIISQCSTLFVMRLSNDRDQALIRSAVSDAGASMLTFVPTLGTGEVFAFGAGVPLPTRMKFRELPVAQRPTSEAGGNTRVGAGASPDRDLINSVIDRWRASTMSHKAGLDDDGDAAGRRPAAARPRRHSPRARGSAGLSDSPPLQPQHRLAPPVQPAQPGRNAPPRLAAPAASRGPASCASRSPERPARTIRRRCRAATGRTHPPHSGTPGARQPAPIAGVQPRAENRAADPHVGGAHRNRGRKIRAHPHRQQLEPVAPGDLGGQREMRRRRFIGGGMHISPAIARP